jgi:hypothetical protein
MDHPVYTFLKLGQDDTLPGAEDSEFLSSFIWVRGIRREQSKKTQSEGVM